MWNEEVAQKGSVFDATDRGSKETIFIYVGHLKMTAPLAVTSEPTGCRIVVFSHSAYRFGTRPLEKNMHSMVNTNT